MVWSLRQNTPTRPPQEGWPLIELLGPLNYARPIRKVKHEVELPGAPRVRLTWENGLSEQYDLEIIGSGAGRSVMGTRGGLYALKLQRAEWHESSNAK
eukprot:10605229-Lingulodinium_polyedra.AAC.1